VGADRAAMERDDQDIVLLRQDEPAAQMSGEAFRYTAQSAAEELWRAPVATRT